MLGGAQIDLLLTDPPYGVNYHESAKARVVKVIENDNLTIEETRALWDKVFILCIERMKEGANYYVFSPQGGNQADLMVSISEAGFLLKHVLVWVKNTAVFGRCDYNYKHEPILYGWKPGGAHYFGGTPKETSIWECDRPMRSKFHPTMKPIPLFERVCINGARRGENVYDPFCGSGTTLLACEGTGRRGFGMELDPAYCSVILQRLSEMGLTPELVEEAE